MLDWTDEQKMLRDALREFALKEVVPLVGELEHGDLPPYDTLRKLFAAFGIDAMARDGFTKRLARDGRGDAAASGDGSGSSGFDPGLMLVLISELSRYCPGMVTALAVSVGLTAAAIDSRGTVAQRQRWVPDLLSLERIGAWALTEPGAGSDAFGAMRSTARRDPDGDGYILNGSKTFITNGPYADVIVFICKLDDGTPPERRKVLSFVLERGMEGLEQSRPLRKMGMHSSPTGEVFVTDVRAGTDRLLGESEETGSDARAAPRTPSPWSGPASPRWHSASSTAASTCVSTTPTTACSSATHRRVPAHPGEAGSHGGGPTQRPEPRVPMHRGDHREPAARPRRDLGDEAVLGTCRHRGRPRRRPDLRRQRLHGRASRRTAGPRRQGAADLRRNGRTADHAHRPGAAPTGST